MVRGKVKDILRIDALAFIESNPGTNQGAIGLALRADPIDFTVRAALLSLEQQGAIRVRTTRKGLRYYLKTTKNQGDKNK